MNVIKLCEPETEYARSPVIKIKRIIHRNEKRLMLKFDYNKELIKSVKLIPGVRWSATRSCWHVRDSARVIKKVYDTFNYKGIIFLPVLCRMEKK